MPYYIHKHEVRLAKGGSEEGDWWYDCGTPVDEWNPSSHAFITDEAASHTCRLLNAKEHVRRLDEEDYPYHSVLASGCTYYEYSVSNDYTKYSYPEVRLHYE